ncbi:MAG: hypothetical protein Q8K98_02710 [Bacteroidota bacterium]|nr:hypothetical protein [Bacteroidota bacterium]
MRYFFVFIAAVLLVSTLQAQVSVRLNFNLDRQPVWGPTGYDYVEYYYLPDIEVYYYVPQHRFFYYDRGRWISRSALPLRFRNYDFYNSYKVVVNEQKPYRKHKTYKEKYSSYKGRHDQQPIRDSGDSKYFVNKNHPEHNNWVKQQKHDQGKGNDQNNNRDKNKKNKK